MSAQESLADLAVTTLAAIKRIDEGLDTEHPERHAIRDMKRAAERAVRDSLEVAMTITNTARSVRDAFAEIRNPKTN